MRFATAFTLTATLLAACADIPALDDAISPAARNADFPSLLPVDQLVSGAQDVQVSNANFQSRIASLRARAARLRGPVIDRRTRNKMRRAIARHS